MDIEGSEYEVLLSLTPAELARVRRVNVEYHEPRPGESYSKAQLIDHLLGSGLSLTKEIAGMEGYGLWYFDRL